MIVRSFAKGHASNIKEYARTYSELTDEKADELIQKALAFQKQRGELLAKTYDRVKQGQSRPRVLSKWNTSCCCSSI